MENIAITITESTIEYPALSDRVQSSFIDMLLIVIMMFIAASILDRYEYSPDWIRIVLFFGIWGVYEPVCTAFGFTIGNYMKGLRVRQYSNTNKKINIFMAFIRYVLKIGLGWISFLTIHFNNERRAIHDFAAGSVMIRVPRKP